MHLTLADWLKAICLTDLVKQNILTALQASNAIVSPSVCYSLGHLLWLYHSFRHLRCFASCCCILLCHPVDLLTLLFCQLCWSFSVVKTRNKKMIRKSCCVSQNENRLVESGLSEYNQLAGYRFTFVSFLILLEAKVFFWFYSKARELWSVSKNRPQKYCCVDTCVVFENKKKSFAERKSFDRTVTN